MSGFIEGENRGQLTLFPECIDDYISETNPVRVIDVFVDELDLPKLGFKCESKATGRPGYHPSTMLKIYIYGYLNRIQSSRRLETESQRNFEMMWLTNRLSPDFKTISDFRKDNTGAIKQVCRQFTLICTKLNLFSEAFVAIDGSKFKAVNNRDKNFTKAKMKDRLERIDKSIEKYLKEIEKSDSIATEKSIKNFEQLKERVYELKKEMNRLKALEKEMLKSPDQQLSLTDPDARSMKTRGQGVVGYNVQASVDTKNHLIISHEVTNVGNDRSALHKAALDAKEVIGTDDLSIVADRGYFSGKQLHQCEKDGIKTHVPRPATSGNKGKDFFDKSDFVWIAKDNEYECPAGERLIYRYTHDISGIASRRYWSSNCKTCLIKKKCTKSTERRVDRTRYEDSIDIVLSRLESKPDAMIIRRSTVEHPFGTIKAWMGYTHFQLKTLKKVAAEMSLHVLSYNLKRVIKIIGVKNLIHAVQVG